MASYTDADAIAAWLGVTFTPEQEAQAEALAAAVTAFIDSYTGRTWQTVSPVVGELRNVLPPREYGGFGVVHLACVPAVAVSAVVLRTGYPHATETTLDTDQFELVDPPNGILTLTGADGYLYPALLALVDYTYTATVPADVELAALLIAQGQMARTLAVQAGSQALAANPQLAGMESVSVGQNDVSIKVSSGIGSGSLAGSSSSSGSSWVTPGSTVAALLNPWRRVVLA